ncbi:MAG: phenylacetate--CoA ligase family protein [Planctomycetota bacterium]
MGLVRLFRTGRRLARLERETPEAIARLQERRLRAILKHAAAQSPAYRELYRGIDFDGCRLQDVPVVTKAQLMDRFEDFVTDPRLKLGELKEWMDDPANMGRRYLGEYIPCWTSGSTGRVGVFVYTAADLELTFAAVAAHRFTRPGRRLRLLRTLLGRKTRVATVIVAGGPNPGATGVQHFPRAPGLIARTRTFSLRSPMEEIVEGLNEFQPDRISAYPSVLAALAREQLQGHLKLRFDKPGAGLGSMSEPLLPGVRDLARRAWGLEIREIYGAAECMAIAQSCRLVDRMHLLSHLCILEAVDGKNRPVPNGTPGEKVLLTNLFNRVQPIIRYDLGDVTGYSSEACSCGSPFPRLLPVQGRAQDVLYIDRPGGGHQPLHSFVLTTRPMRTGTIQEHQLIQTGRNAFTFRYVPHDSSAALEPVLREALNVDLESAGLIGRVRVEFERVSGIAADPRTGKIKRVIHEVGDPPVPDGPASSD